MNTIRTTLSTFFILILLVLPAGTRAAAGPDTPTPPAASVQPENPAGIETFVDEFFAAEMERLHIPGAVVVFVQDGQVLFQKGYGQANLEIQSPVRAEETLFRAGSISKLFVTTALLQLVEEGRVRLDAPVSEYLPDIPIDNPFDTPVTLAHLLTHTGGFDEKMAGMGVYDPAEIQPLGEYLAENLPPVVMPPGDQISYSNHGFALAGLVVERVSGIPFADYIQQNIFVPLGMSASSFAEPLPEPMLAQAATGYAFSENAYIPLPYDLLNVSPAGSLYTTAPDMARFMLANLDTPVRTGDPILAPETLAMMHSRQFSQHPELAGWAYGFYEQFQNGRRALLHGGDLAGFSSLLYLLPEEDFGFFLSVNTSMNPIFGSDLRETFTRELLDRFFPGENGLPAAAAGNIDVTRFEGNYRWNRYVRTTVFKGLPPNPMLQFHLRATPEGNLEMTPPLGMGETIIWEPVNDMLFKEAGGENLMAFREDNQGNITHQFMTYFGTPIVNERVQWYETDTFQASLLVAMLVLFLTTLAWGLAWLFRRLTGRKNPVDATTRRARRLAGAAAAMVFLFLFGLAGIMGQLSLAPFAPIPAGFSLLLAIPMLMIVVVLVLAWAGFQLWKNRDGSLFSRVHLTLLAGSAAAFVWFSAYWNLLGWQF